jgi:hypothetical protein
LKYVYDGGIGDRLTSVDAVIEERPRGNVDVAAAVGAIVEAALELGRLVVVLLLKVVVCHRQFILVNPKIYPFSTPQSVRHSLTHSLTSPTHNNLPSSKATS